jgi:hypothetical protein
MGFADATAAGRSCRPREERQDRARTAGLVAVIEVIGRWIIEVDRFFDEAQAEVARVEVEIP